MLAMLSRRRGSTFRVVDSPCIPYPAQGTNEMLSQLRTHSRCSDTMFTDQRWSGRKGRKEDVKSRKQHLSSATHAISWRRNPLRQLLLQASSHSVTHIFHGGNFDSRGTNHRRAAYCSYLAMYIVALYGKTKGNPVLKQSGSSNRRGCELPLRVSSGPDPTR